MNLGEGLPPNKPAEGLPTAVSGFGTKEVGAFQAPRVPKPTASPTRKPCPLSHRGTRGTSRLRVHFNGFASTKRHRAQPLTLGASPVVTDRKESTPELTTEQTHLSLCLAQLTQQSHGDPSAPSHATGGLRELIKADSVKASWQILLKQPPPWTQVIATTFMVE